MLTRIGVLPVNEPTHRQAPQAPPSGAMAFVKRVRLQLGIPQTAMADALGISQSQYSQMEKNRAPGYLPKPEQVAIIAKILRVRQAEILSAAGYLTDSPARRLDDDGDQWIADRTRRRGSCVHPLEDVRLSRETPVSRGSR